MKRGRQIDLFHINEIERSLEVDTQHKTDEKLLSRVFEKKNSKEFSLNSMFFLIVLRLLLTRKIPYSLQKKCMLSTKVQNFTMKVETIISNIPYKSTVQMMFNGPIRLRISRDLLWIK